MELKNRVYVARSGIHGKGLFARRHIMAGEYIGTFEGPVAKRNGSHVLWVYDGENWEGRRGQNALRYLNHSENYNAEFQQFDLYAICNIKEGAEITIDYEW
ncbi:MAG: SET domain-containing protein [Gammaproteobacteria bacterium]|nr:MAG: SET domain-containing protein [Gammaproteobacteria bacterium]